MNKKRAFLRIISVFFAITAVILILTSCSSGAKGDVNYDSPGYDYDKEFESGSNTPGISNEEDSWNSNKGEYEVKIIRTAFISAQTKDYDKAITDIEASIAECEGYIESSRITGKSVSSYSSYPYRVAEYTIRIPADNLDKFLDETGNLVNVLSVNTSATDITSQYYDTVSRIEVLKTEKAVLESMLAASTEVNQMLMVEERLYNVISELESYQTKLNVYENKVAYSTVTLTLNEVAELTTVAENPGFGERISTAFTDSWKGFASFCKDIAVGFVYALPAILVLATVVCIIVIIRKAYKKKRSGKSE